MRLRPGWRRRCSQISALPRFGLHGRDFCKTACFAFCAHSLQLRRPSRVRFHGRHFGSQSLGRIIARGSEQNCLRMRAKRFRGAGEQDMADRLGARRATGFACREHADTERGQALGKRSGQSIRRR